MLTRRKFMGGVGAAVAAGVAALLPKKADPPGSLKWASEGGDFEGHWRAYCKAHIAELKPITMTVNVPRTCSTNPGRFDWDDPAAWVGRRVPLKDDRVVFRAGTALRLPDGGYLVSTQLGGGAEGRGQC